MTRVVRMTFFRLILQCNVSRTIIIYTKMWLLKWKYTEVTQFFTELLLTT